MVVGVLKKPITERRKEQRLKMLRNAPRPMRKRPSSVELLYANRQFVQRNHGLEACRSWICLNNNSNCYGIRIKFSAPAVALRDDDGGVLGQLGIPLGGPPGRARDEFSPSDPAITHGDARHRSATEPADAAARRSDRLSRRADSPAHSARPNTTWPPSARRQNFRKITNSSVPLLPDGVISLTSPCRAGSDRLREIATTPPYDARRSRSLRLVWSTAATRDGPP